MPSTERDVELTMSAAAARHLALIMRGDTDGVDPDGGCIYCREIVAALKVAALKGTEQVAEPRPANCPTCRSNSPDRHPAVQFEGKGQPCKDPWHSMSGKAAEGAWPREIVFCLECGAAASSDEVLAPLHHRRRREPSPGVMSQQHGTQTVSVLPASISTELADKVERACDRLEAADSETEFGDDFEAEVGVAVKAIRAALTRYREQVVETDA